MIGGTALDQAPDEWQALAGQDSEPELALLAITSQATHLLHRRAPTSDIEPAKRLPRLTLPPLSNALRLKFRRLNDVLKPTNDQMALILRLMATRGFSVHPADWMPSSVDDLPDVYAPWSDWRERTEDDPLEALTSENWDAWMPAERRLALRAMRREDPAQALTLIEQHAPALVAEQRVRVIECLGVGLRAEDAEFLKGLDSDRSGKVRALAAQFLARLGQISDDDANAGELADFFTIASAGILKRGKVLTQNKLKNKAQRARRTELFSLVSLAGFAGALGLSDVQTVEMWTDKDPTSIPEFAGMIARTGADGVIGPALDRLLDFEDTRTEMVAAMILRLPADQRRAFLTRLLRRDETHLVTSVACMQDSLGAVGMKEFDASGVLKEITAAVKAYVKDENRRNDAVLQIYLMSLGLLADAAAATELSQRFIEMGMISADPALAMLTFNAALTGESP